MHKYASIPTGDGGCFDWLWSDILTKRKYKMKKLLTTSLLCLAIGSTSMACAMPARAEPSTPQKNTTYTFECGALTGDESVQTSIDFTSYMKKYCSGKDSSPVTALLLMVIDIMAVGVGIAVVFGLAWGGFMFASARDDTSKTKQGISIILNSVIGLLLFLGLYALANFFVPGGLFKL